MLTPGAQDKDEVDSFRVDGQRTLGARLQEMEAAEALAQRNANLVHAITYQVCRCLPAGGHAASCQFPTCMHMPCGCNPPLHKMTCASLAANVLRCFLASCPCLSRKP